MSVREIPIAVRAHTVLPKKEKPVYFQGKKKEDLRLPYGVRIMVIDTETTTDIYQNLLFGLAVIYESPGKEDQVYNGGVEKEAYLIYVDDLSEKDRSTLKEFAKEREAQLLSRNEFIYQVFWSEIWEYGTVCVGFNLPFDLSRLAISVKTFKRGKFKDMFEFKLCDSIFYPTLLIKPIDSKKAFIELRFPTRPNTKTSKRKPFRQGRFVDLRTLTFALTNESHSLDSACKLYQVENGKMKATEHGKITLDYCRYNAQDVQATFELYCKVKEEFDKHSLALEAGKAYSPATIGKAYYRAMGIKSLSEIQLDFPPNILGYAMAAYYGGRSECHYRGKPVKDFHTDVTSMYPSVFTLQNLWSWVIANNFNVKEDTATIRNMVDEITIDKLFDKKLWPSIPGLVQIKPNGDLLPVRAEYKEGKGFQIGLNYLTTNEPMWYTLADILASKVLTGKTPEIIKAIRIISSEPQEDLRKIMIRDEIPINPAKDNFFKRVIELRKEIKKKSKAKGDEADSMQLFLKILANSTSYGVYIEIKREEMTEETQVQVHGLRSFPYSNKQAEINGKYYNPLIAVMITGAARLILAMMEKTTLDLGGNFAFCDTDSMSIIDLKNERPEAIGRKVVERFKSIFPYKDETGTSSLLEAEDYNWKRLDWNKETDKGNIAKGEYYPLFCYMVSAKRYVLYNLVPDEQGNLKVVIRKKSDHGLGHLSSPIKGKRNDWVDDVWKRIICQEHGLPFEEPEWFYKPALAQLSVSKPSLYNILSREKDKPYFEKVKPFNFMLVAYPEGTASLFGADTLISEFYCRKYKAIGYNSCQNKGKCKYSGSCYSNLHKTPITPFADVVDVTYLPWLEKNTKQPMVLKVSGNKSYKAKQVNDLVNEEVLLLQDNNRDITIKNYWDFIKDYHLHPESKYDDQDGNPCSKSSKGLLQRTHVKVVNIIHIGKETNTLQNSEEKDILPNEQFRDDMILNYVQGKRPDRKLRIDTDQWQSLLPILKDKAKPRKEFGAKLGISERYLKQLLAAEYLPSVELFEKVLALAKENQWSRVKPSGPRPMRFKEDSKGHIMPLNWMVDNLRVSRGTVLAELEEYTFILYGMEYLDMKPETVKDTLRQWREGLKQVVMGEKKKAAEQPPRVKGICLSDEEGKIVEFDVGEIVAYRARRIKGRNYWTLVVLTKDNRVYDVLQKNNRFLFKSFLLPYASEGMSSWRDTQKVTENRKEIEYGPWIEFNVSGEQTSSKTLPYNNMRY